MTKFSKDTGFTYYSTPAAADQPIRITAFCGAIRMVLDAIETGLKINSVASMHLEHLDDMKTAAVALEAARFYRGEK
jgi:hypothetical protein